MRIVCSGCRTLTLTMLIGAGLCAEPLTPPPAAVETASKMFARTQYREAIAALSASSQSEDAGVLFLLGKSYFMLNDYKKASEFFESAVRVQPANSAFHHWLGRSYGRRAETGNPLMAPGLAGKARQSFEKAVSLDGKNLEALSDLFSYYLEAPGFLGGGTGKAADMVQKIKTVDAAEAESAFAELARKRKDFASEEQHLRKAIDAAPDRVGLRLDLARFLSRQGRHEESDAAFLQAEKMGPNQPKLLYSRAQALVEAKRNLSEAKALLARYLKAPLTPDDPPRFEAERLLKQIRGAA